jgi:hypothetical protein
MGSSKTFQAKGNDIPVVTEEWVNQSIKAGKLSTDKSQILSGEVSGSSNGAASKGPAKKSKAKAAAASEDEEEEEEEDEKPKKKAAAKKAPAAAAASGGVFDGETFCVSGSFTVSQADMRALVAQNGGNLADTPNRKCTYLVADQLGSAKTAKAQKDGIDIVTEDWVRESIKAGKKSTDSSLFLSGGGAAAFTPMDDDEDDKPVPAKKAATKRKKPSSDDEADADADDDDAPKKAAKKSTASGPSASSGSSGSVPAAKIVKVVVKGSAPVDSVCPVHASCHVYSTGSDVYDAMLNQTNIGNNNSQSSLHKIL